MRGEAGEYVVGAVAVEVIGKHLCTAAEACGKGVLGPVPGLIRPPGLTLRAAYGSLSRSARLWFAVSGRSFPPPLCFKEVELPIAIYITHAHAVRELCALHVRTDSDEGPLLRGFV